MKLSLCITTYNRYEMTIESFAKVLDDSRIDDIVIMDDASTDGSGVLLHKYFSASQKVSVLLQAKNKGMSRNKRDAIANAKNEWAIILDSDNIITSDYLDAFNAYTGHFDNKLHGSDNYIFCPDFAKPQFDYTKYSERFRLYDADACAENIKKDDFNCLMNTCNYIVNRDYYCATYIYNPEHIASDTIWHNYNHLKSGGLFAVVPGMQYEHRVHKGSGFLKDAQRNMLKANEVRELIQQL